MCTSLTGLRGGTTHFREMLDY